MVTFIGSVRIREGETHYTLPYHLILLISRISIPTIFCAVYFDSKATIQGNRQLRFS